MLILNTVGDHIRKRRLELKLFQRDVAQILGVDTSTVTNWEKHRTQPQLYIIPKVIAFLGYDPDASAPKTLGEKIREYRRTHGLSQRKLAALLDIDPSTLARWERGEGRVGIELKERLAQSFHKPT